MPENVLAYEIYARCGSQIIVAGFGQVIGINILAVYRVMETFDVKKEDELLTLDKILSLHETHFPMKKEDEDVARRPR